MIDLIIILMYITIAAALAATAWAMVRTAKVIGKTSGKVHGVPVRRIKIAVCSIVVLSLCLSYAFASTTGLRINTALYTDTFWLRTANMFTFTLTVAIGIAAIATVYNFIRARK